MRRRDKHARPELAWALLRRAPAVHLATTDAHGAPLLRVLHAVVVEGAICFHGARSGEKREATGRPAVVSAHEIVAEIPSHFQHPERACPATTYYRSAMAHGVLEDVQDDGERAAVLQALMERYQPEGEHRPITAEDPMYAAAVRGIAIWRLRPERISAKAGLGQKLTPRVRRRVLDRLWARGGPGDAAAIEAMLEVAPDDPLPPFLSGPRDTRVVVAPGERHVAGAVEILRGAYWNVGASDACIAAAQLGSQAWVVAVAEGRVVATARAISDGAGSAYVADVAVADGWRGAGLGTRVMEALLDHPAIRNVRRVGLATVDAGPFYARLGFSRLEGREMWRRVRCEETARHEPRRAARP